MGEVNSLPPRTATEPAVVQEVEEPHHLPQHGTYGFVMNALSLAQFCRLPFHARLDAFIFSLRAVEFPPHRLVEFWFRASPVAFSEVVFETFPAFHPSRSRHFSS